jgi:hypothetical protein
MLPRAALLLLFAACSSPRPEVASLAVSVDRFHRASNDERPARADDLALVACRDAEVCAAKALCVEATTATATALRLKHEAETLLDEVQAGKRDGNDPTVLALPAKLDQASSLLMKGHDAMPACDQKILVLRERYGL